MPPILSYASPHQPLRGRPLPQWAWLLAYLFFPIGPFIALVAARLLTWPKAIVLAVVAYGTGAGMVFLFLRLQDSDSFLFRHFLGGLLPLLFFFAWSTVIYRIGRAADYWSRRTRRTCIILIWIVLALGLLNILISISLLIFFQKGLYVT